MTSAHDYLPKETSERLSDKPLSPKVQNLTGELADLARRADLVSSLDTQEEPQQDEPAQTQNYELESPPRAFSYSVACEEHPERNEDSHFAIDIPGRVLAGGVFDGVGGLEGSKKAAEIAAETIVSSFAILAADTMTPENAGLFAQDRIKVADNEITNNKESLRIATTVALANICTNPNTGERFASIAWAGDSRVYVIRQCEILYRTRDDGVHDDVYILDDLYPNEKLEYRAQAFYESVTEMPPFELWPTYYDRNVVTNYLGARTRKRELVVNIVDIIVQPGDIVLATSDGIHDNLTNTEILEVINTGGGVKELVEAALSRSRDEGHIRAKPDDMTAVLLTA